MAVALATLDLFSGIGGFARGFEATGSIETTCFVEQDPYCQAVLRHHWPDVPILGDIRDVKGCELPIQPDVICGGFPCQPFSQAGKQLAQDDPRHLWPEMFRLIRECRPAWVVGENVAGLIKLGLDEVLSDLEGEGYATRTFNLPACAVGAPHIRQRLWIIAHADSQGEPDKPFDGAGQLGFGFVADTKRGRRGQNREQRGLDKVSRSGAHAKLPIKKSSPDVAHAGRHATRPREEMDGDTPQWGQGIPDATNSRQDVADTDNGHRPRKVEGVLGEKGRETSDRLAGECEAVADTKSAGGQARGRDGMGTTDRSRGNKGQSPGSGSKGDRARRPEDYWQSEPAVGRLADGIPNRVSQLRALGNTIIPQIAEEIGHAIVAATEG